MRQKRLVFDARSLATAAEPGKSLGGVAPRARARGDMRDMLLLRIKKHATRGDMRDMLDMHMTGQQLTSNKALHG